MSRASVRTNKASADWSNSQRPLSPPPHTASGTLRLSRHASCKADHRAWGSRHLCQLLQPCSAPCSICSSHPLKCRPPRQVLRVSAATLPTLQEGRRRWAGGAAHCQRSGGRRSSQAWHSTRSPTCGAAGSCSRSARAWLRDQNKAGSEIPVSLCKRCFASYQGHGSVFDVGSRTFALTQSLEGRLVAHGDLARLHDKSQTRVDALNSRLLLLQSTGRDGRAEATAAAEGVWAAHKQCEQVHRVPGQAGGGRATADILTRAKERTLPLAVSPILPKRLGGRLKDEAR